MRRFLAVTAAGLLLALAALSPAIAQEPGNARGKRMGPLGPGDNGMCYRHWRCGPSGCGWHKICGNCPDRHSCWPLYGAYGPYGGVGYWGAYSPNLWGMGESYK